MQNFFETYPFAKDPQEISNYEKEKSKQEHVLRRKQENEKYNQQKVDPETGLKITITDPTTGLQLSEKQLNEQGIKWVTRYDYNKQKNKKRQAENQKKYDKKLLHPNTGLEYKGEQAITPITMSEYRRKKFHKRKVDPKTGIQILNPDTGMEFSEEQLKAMEISWVTQQDYNAVKHKENLNSMISVKPESNEEKKKAEKLMKLKSKSTIVCPKTGDKITDPEAIKRGEGKTRSAIYNARARSKYKDIRVDPKTELRITDPIAIEKGEGIKLATLYKKRTRMKDIIVDPQTGIELNEEEKNTKKGIKNSSYITREKRKKKAINNQEPEVTLKIEPDLDNYETDNPILVFDKKSVKKVIATLNIHNKNTGQDNCAAFSEQILRYFLTGKKPPNDIVLASYSLEQFSCVFFYGPPVIKIEEGNELEKDTAKNNKPKEDEMYHPEKIEIFRSDIYRTTILGSLFPPNVLAYEEPGTNVVELDNTKKIIEVDYCTQKSVPLTEIDRELKKLATNDPNHVSFGAIALAKFGFKKKKETTEEIKIEDSIETLQSSGDSDEMETEDIGNFEEKIQKSQDFQVHFKVGHLLTYFATPKKVYYVDPERWHCVENDRSIFHNLDKAFKFDPPANPTNTTNSTQDLDQDVFSRRIFYTPLDYHLYINKKRNQTIDLNEDKLRHLNSSSEKKNKKFKSNLDQSGNAQVINHVRNSFLLFEQQAAHGKSLLDPPSSTPNQNNNQTESFNFDTCNFNFAN